MNCPVKDPIDQTLANTVIAALPARARQNLLADASFVEMQSPGVLACAGTPMAHAWFPTTGVISVLTPQAHGRTLEIDMIGFESVLDAGCALGVAAPAFDAEVQVTGHAWCIETRALAAHMQTSTILRNALVRRLYLSLAKVGQRSVCSKILPGFRMFFGSSARLMVRIMSTAPAPASSSKKPILCRPTPCSPVQVPPMRQRAGHQLVVQLRPDALLGSFGSSR
jgi:hypothetical protein